MTDTSVPADPEETAEPEKDDAASDETTEAPRTAPVTEHPKYPLVEKLLGALGVQTTENSVRNALDVLDADEKGDTEPPADESAESSAQ